MTDDAERDTHYKAIEKAARNRYPQHHGVSEHVDRQMLVLIEETGEAAGAWRRYTGRARVDVRLSAVVEELADVVITAYVTAKFLNVNLDKAIDDKLEDIKKRGGL